MAVKAKHPVILSIVHDDLAAILTEHFCYGPLDTLHVVAVNTNDGGGFDIGLEPKPAPEPQVQA